MIDLSTKALVYLQLARSPWKVGTSANRGFDSVLILTLHAIQSCQGLKLCHQDLLTFQRILQLYASLKVFRLKRRTSH